jgi:hypothetical protein
MRLGHDSLYDTVTRQAVFRGLAYTKVFMGIRMQVFIGRVCQHKYCNTQSLKTHIHRISTAIPNLIKTKILIPIKTQIPSPIKTKIPSRDPVE